MRGDKTGLSSSPDAELKTYVGIFEILPTGLDIRAFLRAFRGTIRNIGQLLGGGFVNKGAKYCPLQNFSAFDFAIKHDPIPSDD